MLAARNDSLAAPKVVTDIPNQAIRPRRDKARISGVSEN
jgi:hypothetical protein